MSKRFLLILLIMFALYAWVAFQLISPLALPNVLTWILYGICAAAPISQIVAMQRRMADKENPSLLTAFSFLSMGAFWIALCLVIVRSGVIFVLELADKMPAHFLEVSAWVCIFAVVAGLIFGFYEATRTPRVRRVQVPIESLDDDLVGYTIAQISDLHISPQIGDDFVTRVVNTTNALNPDSTVLTGDIVDTSLAQGEKTATLLGNLKARDGVFYATGNHEYYNGVEPWIKALKQIGLTVLLNEHKTISVKSSTLVMGGLTDRSGGSFHEDHKMNPQKTLEGAPEASFKVGLAHQPRVAKDLARAGFDLMLAGHTHGGQIFPWNFLVRLQQPTVRGLAKVGKMVLYTSSGTGFWGPPMRVFAPSEITLLTLCKKAG